MRAIATCWLVMLLFGGCERAEAPTKQAPKPTDPVVATVDGEPLRLSWVTERLNQDTKHDVEAKARALAAAAADVICLREFAVLKLRPNLVRQLEVLVTSRLSTFFDEVLDLNIRVALSG